jgi:hypothetical protein
MFIYSGFLFNDGAPQSGFRFADGPDADDEVVEPVDHDPDFDYGELPEVDGDDAEGGEDDDKLGSGESSDDGLLNTDKTDSPASSFKPYEFKGKVDGEDVSQTFKSKKEMDIALARGIQAPKIFNALKDAKADLAKYKADAEWANDLQSLATERPEEFFEHVVEELVPIEKLANWVAQKHADYVALANMSQAERARELKLREHDKLLKEQAFSREQQAKAEQAKAAALHEQEKVQLATWRQKEVAKWEKNLPESVKPRMDKYIRAVLLEAQAHINAGNDFTLRDMSASLEEMLQPLINMTQNPSALKKEEAKKVEDRKQSETQKLRNMSATSEPQKKMSINDVWANATKMAINGAKQVKRGNR